MRPLLTDKLLSDWTTDFDASHISVDDCMADAVGWVWMAVLLPIAVIGLFVAGFFVAKVAKKKRQLELKAMQEVR